jgi:uncharacterized membrane protein
MEVLATSWVIRLLGRFHPTTIHFPIAFLLAAAVLELLGLVRKKPLFPDALFLSLGVGCAGALVSAGLGWADAASLRFDPEDAVTLGVHRWLGTFVAASSSAAWVLQAGLRKGRFQNFRVVFPPLLFGSALAVGIGAHFGGVLVYGRDYYSSALAPNQGSASPSASSSSPSPRSATRFDAEILPLLERHCLRCHGAKKQKGRLRLDSRDFLRRGGKSGPAILPGDASRSLLYRAITDPNPDTRMPQEAPPLPAEAIERLRSWIDQGAP